MIRIINDMPMGNLQEQVYYLTELIGQSTDIVKNISGKVSTESALPDYKSQVLGTTYAVGDNAPYVYYVATSTGWLNLGVFPRKGPRGDNGLNGNSIFFTNANGNTQTTSLNIDSIYNPNNLPITEGNLIIMINNQGTFVFSVTNPDLEIINVSYLTTLSGVQGPVGPQGPTGPAGPIGPAGKSAYASAQDGGFTGTESQFNNGLSVMGDVSGIDTTVTQNSGNLITSGAVYSYIQSLDANGVKY